MSVVEGDMDVAPSNPAGVRAEDLPEQARPRQEIIDGSLHVAPLASAGHQDIVMRPCMALVAVVPGDRRVLPGVDILRRGRRTGGSFRTSWSWRRGLRPAILRPCTPRTSASPPR